MANFGEDEIGVGGDTSVKWNVDVHNVRPRTLRSDQEGPAVHQEGIAETPDNKAFTIAIKLPKDDKGAREKFLAGVLRAVKAPVNDKIVFALPIEDGNMDCATGKGRPDCDHVAVAASRQDTVEDHCRQEEEITIDACRGGGRGRVPRGRRTPDL